MSETKIEFEKKYHSNFEAKTRESAPFFHSAIASTFMNVLALPKPYRRLLRWNTVVAKTN